MLKQNIRLEARFDVGYVHGAVLMLEREMGEWQGIVVQPRTAVKDSPTSTNETYSAVYHLDGTTVFQTGKVTGGLSRGTMRLVVASSTGSVEDVVGKLTELYKKEEIEFVQIPVKPTR